MIVLLYDIALPQSCIVYLFPQRCNYTNIMSGLRELSQRVRQLCKTAPNFPGSLTPHGGNFPASKYLHEACFGKCFLYDKLFYMAFYSKITPHL